MSKMKLVDYASTSGSMCGELSARTPSVRNEIFSTGVNYRNEHYDILVGMAMEDVHTKSQLSSMYGHRVIGILHEAPDTSLSSHLASSYNLVDAPFSSSMVCHATPASLCSSTVTLDPLPLHKVDLWQHLKNVCQTSFGKAAKRKAEKESLEKVVASFSNLNVSERRVEPLHVQFKKLCLGDDALVCDELSHHETASVSSKRTPATATASDSLPAQRTIGESMPYNSNVVEADNKQIDVTNDEKLAEEDSSDGSSVSEGSVLDKHSHNARLSVGDAGNGEDEVAECSELSCSL